MVVFMDDLRKKKLLQYLFPTEEIRKFVCNDLFIELSEVIKTTDCISSKNLNNKVRLSNKENVLNQINNFLNENPIYTETLLKLYNQKEISQIIEDLLMGYTFYLACSFGRIGEIDIFKDKRSVCYSPISIIDII